MSAFHTQVRGVLREAQALCGRLRVALGGAQFGDVLVGAQHAHHAAGAIAQGARMRQHVAHRTVVTHDAVFEAAVVLAVEHPAPFQRDARAVLGVQAIEPLLARQARARRHAVQRAHLQVAIDRRVARVGRPVGDTESCRLGGDLQPRERCAGPALGLAQRADVDVRA
jgi:hypothetical protein